MYEELFRQRALENFHLAAEDWVQPVTLESVLADILTISQKAKDEQRYKQGIRTLMKQHCLFQDMCDHPDMLSKHELLALSDIQMHLRRNAGRSCGFFKYRREHTEAEMARYCDIVLAQKMHLLANRETLFHFIKEQMEMLHSAMEEDKLVRQSLVAERHQKQKNEWGNRFVMCGCGVEYTLSNKCRHVKTKKHREWVGGEK
jgi:hypothetical protein